MASRAKQKRMMDGGRDQILAENIAAFAKADCTGFVEGIRQKDEAFRRGVTARKAVMDMIERDGALKKRAEEIFEEGRQVGFKQAGWPIIKCCMAGACLMLRDEFGMTDDEIVRGLKTLHEKMAWALNYSEMAEDVLEKTGIRLQLDDPMEPVRDIR